MAQIKIGRGLPSDFSSLATKDQNEIYFINSNNPQDSNIYVGDKMMATMDLAELATGDVKGTIYYSGGSGNTVSKLVFNSSTDAGKFLSVNSSGVLSWAAALTSYVQSNWLTENTSDASYIQNRPSMRGSLGANSIIEGDLSHNIADGIYSHAEGSQVYAYGTGSHAEGNSTYTEGTYSHAEGVGSLTVGTGSHAEGSYTWSEGTYSHAEGFQTSSYGIDSHSEGAGSQDSLPGKISGAANATTYTSTSNHGLSVNDLVVCNGVLARVTSVPSATQFTVDHTLSTTALTNAFYFKQIGVAYGNHSHTEGYLTKAINAQEHAEGSCNVSNTGSTSADKTISSIGIGTSDSDRKNAVEVMQNGDVYITGIGDYVGDNYSTAKTLQECIADTQGTGQNMVSVTCYELSELVINSQLVPGQQYRITDYECTTTQENTHSAGHQFDIIVVADSENILNENARAIEHVSVLQIYSEAVGRSAESGHTDQYIRCPEMDYVSVSTQYAWEYVKSSADLEIGDPSIYYTDLDDTKLVYTNSLVPNIGDVISLWDDSTGIVTDLGDPYFHKCKLESWELKYCIDNDTTRFHWAAEARYILTADYDDYIEDPHGPYQPEPFNEFLETLSDVAAQSDEYEYSGTLVLDGHTYYKWVDTSGSGVNVLTSERHPSVSNVIRSISDFGRIVAYIQNDALYDNSSAGVDETYITRYDEVHDIIYIDHISVLDGGYGVVYYMKDEWNNECPYDFKNIQFKRWAVTAYQNCPSLVVDNEDNYYGYYYGAKSLNGGNVLSDATYGNDFGWFYTFALKDLESGDWFDYTVVSNLGLKNDENCEVSCYDNHLEPATEEFSSGKGEMAKMLNNIVFFNCYTDLSDTSYAEDVSRCNNNRFLGNCHSNTFGSNCYNNSFGNNCFKNSFGNGCYTNSFGNSFYSNTFGDNCCSNSFGNHCSRNLFGNYCQYNTFGNGCQYIRFSNSSGTTRNYYQYIIVEGGNGYINLDCTGTLSSSSIFRNVKISQGVNNTSTTSTYKTIQDSRTNQTFQTVYQPENSEIISV